MDTAVMHLFCGTESGEDFQEAYYHSSVRGAIESALEIHSQPDRDFSVRAWKRLIGYLSTFVKDGCLKIIDPVDSSYSLVYLGNQDRDKENIKKTFNLACDLEDLDFAWEWSDTAREYICHLQGQHRIGIME